MKGQKCSECGSEIHGEPWVEIRQYEQKHAKANEGYRNLTALRESTGRALCSGCVALSKRGIPRGQGALV